MIVTFCFIVAKETLLALAEEAIRSFKKSMRSSIFDVSKRSKLSRPPGRGAGMDDLRSLGCDERDAMDALDGPADGGSLRSPGVRAPFGAGRRIGGEGSEGARE